MQYFYVCRWALPSTKPIFQTSNKRRDKQKPKNESTAHKLYSKGYFRFTTLHMLWTLVSALTCFFFFVFVAHILENEMRNCMLLTKVYIYIYVCVVCRIYVGMNGLLCQYVYVSVTHCVFLWYNIHIEIRIYQTVFNDFYAHCIYICLFEFINGTFFPTRTFVFAY